MAGCCRHLGQRHKSDSNAPEGRTHRGNSACTQLEGECGAAGCEECAQRSQEGDGSCAVRCIYQEPRYENLEFTTGSSLKSNDDCLIPTTIGGERHGQEGPVLKCRATPRGLGECCVPIKQNFPTSVMGSKKALRRRSMNIRVVFCISLLQNSVIYLAWQASVRCPMQAPNGIR